MSTSPAPLVVWLGEPPPAPLGGHLQSFCRLHLGWTQGAALTLVWAGSGTEILRGLPPPGRRPPVIAAVSSAPSVRERLSWIRAGADDLVPVNELAGAAVRLLFPDGNIPVLAEAPQPGRDGLHLHIDGQPFPPALLPAPEHEGPAFAWTQCMARYLGVRNAISAELGPGGVARLQEMFHLRERAIAALDPHQTSDPFGQRRSTAEPPLGWPAAVRHIADEGANAAVRESTIIGVGSEGLIFTSTVAVDPGERMVVDLPSAPGSQAQAHVEARWQRRLSRQIWHIGALATRLDLRAVPEH